VNPTRTVLKKDVNALKPRGGPQTPEGKAQASQNSLRHGLTAKQAVIRGEDQSEFDALLTNLTADRKPQGELEIQLTGEIAACMWRLARARQHEANLLQRAMNVYEYEPKRLELIMRYVGSIERQLNRTIVRFEFLQTQRRKTTESVSQTTENTDHSQLKTHNPPLVMTAGHRSLAANHSQPTTPQLTTGHRPPATGHWLSQATTHKSPEVISSFA
jgi:hypothetical protein